MNECWLCGFKISLKTITKTDQFLPSYTDLIKLLEDPIVQFLCCFCFSLISNVYDVNALEMVSKFIWDRAQTFGPDKNNEEIRDKLKGLWGIKK